jgi:zinc transporter, ZIP family
MHVLEIMLIGLVSGVTGTGCGGLAAFFINNISNRFLSVILEFSAGLMTSVVCFKLIPEAFEFGGIAITTAGIFSGVIALIIIEGFISKANLLKKGNPKNNILRAGILTAIGIALHNFPEGFAVGSGFEASTGLGITLTIVILIHDIPEGIATAVPLRAGGFSKRRSFLLTVLSGVPMGLGALIGAILGEISKAFIAACLGFAGGAMLYIVCGGLVTESKRLYRGRLPTIGNIFGMVCGILVSVYN